MNMDLYKYLNEELHMLVIRGVIRDYRILSIEPIKIEVMPFQSHLPVSVTIPAPSQS